MQFPLSKNLYPFSLGCTSCVLPDTALANVKYLAPLVDDIELMFFETPNEENYPSQSELFEIGELLYKEKCSCTIHLPTDKVQHFLKGDSQSYLESLVQILETTTHLPAKAYVLHVGEDNFSPSPEEKELWILNSVKLVTELGNIVPLDNIAIENLYYPWEWNREIVEKSNSSYALDLGHLWNKGVQWESVVQTLLPRCRTIQLHGTDRRDHSALSIKDSFRLKRCAEIIKKESYKQVITCEVFGLNSTIKTLSEVHRVWERLY